MFQPLKGTSLPRRHILITRGAFAACLAVGLVSSFAPKAHAEAMSSAAEAGVNASQAEETASSEPLPFDNFGRGTAPRQRAISVSEGLIPYQGATSYAFTRLTLDLPYLTFQQKSRFSLGLRARLPLVLQAVPGEGRVVGGVGNLQLEQWLSWRHGRPGLRFQHGIAFGGILPAGTFVRADVNSFFQYAAETVYALGTYLAYNLYVQGRTVDLSVELAAGLGVMANTGIAYIPGTQATFNVYWKLRPNVPLVFGVIATPEVQFVTAGLRWQSGHGLELGAGISVPVYDVRQQETDLPRTGLPIHPVLELKHRF